MIFTGYYLKPDTPKKKENRETTVDDVAKLYDEAEYFEEKSDSRQITVDECGISITFPERPVYFNLKGQKVYMYKINENQGFTLFYSVKPYDKNGTPDESEYIRFRNYFLHGKKLMSEKKISIEDFVAFKLIIASPDESTRAHVLSMNSKDCSIQVQAVFPGSSSSKNAEEFLDSMRTFQHNKQLQPTADASAE